jgi:beta-lactam-binding protein with PASTA domain
VPLLDGKYEIHGERQLGAGITAFDATDPDGNPVRVEWIELQGTEAEAAFERHRRLLKRLAREGRATIQDVVGRPGAHFVAWHAPPDGAAKAHDAELDAQITAAGYDPATADVRRVDGRPRLVGLPFRPGTAPVVARDVASDATDGRAPARRTWPWPWRAWALGGALTVAAAALALAGFLARTNDRVVVVPESLGSDYTATSARLHALGLRVEPVVVATADAPSGSVVAVDPEPGTPLRPGRTVRVSVALPPGTVAPTAVPRLIGLDHDEVAERLAAEGLEVGRRVAVHAAAPVGVVLAQAPLAGATVGRGTGVDVVASLGPEPERTFVPDLVGRSLVDARWLAELAGLSGEQVVVERLAAERVATDTVLAQSLEPYASVPVATSVLRLVVADPATPSPTTGLPPLGGLDEARARALAVGFEVRTEYVSHADLPDGVVAQSLPAGAVPSDGALVLTVNARPVPVPRPDATVVVRAPDPREVAYLWFVEPGIPPVVAEVRATTLEGETTLVDRRVVQGGQSVEGAWSTTYPGVVRFDLTLNGEPYGGSLRVP